MENFYSRPWIRFKAYVRSEWWVWVVFLTVVGLVVFSPNLRGGYICDEFEQGFRDGYCSLVEGPVCMVPMTPVCFENLYDNPRAAYHAGYGRGVDEHRKW